jgi:hypothetical protein
MKSGLQRPAEGVLRIWKSKEYSGNMRTGQKDKHWSTNTPQKTKYRTVNDV